MRYPAGVAYQGPRVLYDDQIKPDDLVRRLVYGRPKPMLTDGEQMRYGFYGRLMENLANGHAVLIKECKFRTRAHQLAKQIREEMGDTAFEYVVVPPDDPDGPDPRWSLLMYNKVTPNEVGGPPVGRQWHEEFNRPVSEWVDTREAARILGVSVSYAGTLAREAGVTDTRRYGGQRRMLIRRDALPMLANRPRRHKRRRNRNRYVEDD